MKSSTTRSGAVSLHANPALRRLTLFVIAATLVGFLIPVSAGAIEVKKEINYGAEGGGGRAVRPMRPQRRNPLTPTLQKELSQTIANESDKYVDQESEKKADGKPYVDLEHAQFRYRPSMVGGKVEVKAELEANEYRPSKSNPQSKGFATGNRKKLVFDYKLEGGKWVEVNQPTWVDVTQNGKKTARK